jgi:hypothetical protein
MDKTSKKVIIKAIGITAAVVSLCLFLNVNNTRTSQQFLAEGTYLEEKAHFGSDYEGTKGRISLYFKLDSGEIIQFGKSPLTKVVKPGDRVKVFYRVGAFLKNKIYDRYEPLGPSTYWSGVESSVTQ